MSGLPDWVGTLPQWITAGGIAAIVATILRFVPTYIRAQTDRRRVKQEAEADIRDHYAQEVERYRVEAQGHKEETTGLRRELKLCEEDCDRRLKRLELELWGEKRQRVAEQISLINVIVQSVDAPELKQMLKTLETVQSHMQLERLVNGEGK